MKVLRGNRRPRRSEYLALLFPKAVYTDNSIERQDQPFLLLFLHVLGILEKVVFSSIHLYTVL